MKEERLDNGNEDSPNDVNAFGRAKRRAAPTNLKDK
jgi:hypothetical protein